MKNILLIAIMSIWPLTLFAAGSGGDYDRANNFRKSTQKKVFRQKVNPQWFDNNNKFWYRNDLAGNQREFILVDAIAGTRKPAFDHKRLAKAINTQTDNITNASSLTINNLSFAADCLELLFNFQGNKFKCNLNTYKLKKISKADRVTSSLKPLRQYSPTNGSGIETSVLFINNSKQTVEIFWMTSRRDKKQYHSLAPGKEVTQHTYSGHAWMVANKDGDKIAIFVAEDSYGDAVINDNTLKPRQERKRNGNGSSKAKSPDGKWITFVKEHNVYIRSTKDKTETKLSFDGTEEHGYNGKFHWSPDSKKLVAIKYKAGTDRQVHMIESSPADQLQPKLHSIHYKKPGDDVDINKPALFNITSKKHIPVSDKLFKNPWSITGIRWNTDSKSYTFLFNQRGHQVLRIVSVDANTGNTRAIIDETSKTFIDYAGKSFSHYIDKTSEIIWMSERDGFNHLYLYDAKSGSVKNQITKGKWVVRGVDKIDDEKRLIYFAAGGIVPGQNPYYIQHCRIDFDGTGLTMLTKGNGTHTAKYSPGRRFIIDQWSRIDHPGTTVLRNADSGKLICELEQADWTELLKTGWKPSEPFVAKGRDGKTDIYGIIIRPSNFDPNVKYPIIEKIYAGPHSSHVPKSFTLNQTSQAMAELGFIVVQIDGMGTSHRSKAFHDVCWKKLVDAGFDDRIAWIKAAAKKYPYMDTSRVGIFGGSAGGQNALGALLTHGDFYKVAVADCGCHDNRIDKIWWNEFWMSWPIGPHYEEQSNVTLAKNLKGKLLLTVGELDRNVDPASTMQVVDALIKADKDFDLLVMPGKGHGCGETPYGKRRRRDFFVKHLHGVEPRSNP